MKMKLMLIRIVWIALIKKRIVLKILKGCDRLLAYLFENSLKYMISIVT
jgi:hypothetical protein